MGGGRHTMPVPPAAQVVLLRNGADGEVDRLLAINMRGSSHNDEDSLGRTRTSFGALSRATSRFDGLLTSLGLPPITPASGRRTSHGRSPSMRRAMSSRRKTSAEEANRKTSAEASNSMSAPAPAAPAHSLQSASV